MHSAHREEGFGRAMKSFNFLENFGEIRRALLKDGVGCLVFMLFFGILFFVFFDGKTLGPSRTHTAVEMLTTRYFVDAIFTSPAMETPLLAALISLIAVLTGIVAERPRAHQVAVFTAAVLFALAHSTFRQGFGVLTFWPGYVMATLYSKFAQRGSPVRGLCLATVVHSIHNCVVLALLFISQRLPENL